LKEINRPLDSMNVLKKIINFVNSETKAVSAKGAKMNYVVSHHSELSVADYQLLGRMLVDMGSLHKDVGSYDDAKLWFSKARNMQNVDRDLLETIAKEVDDIDLIIRNSNQNA
jgi:hypothetical protein